MESFTNKYFLAANSCEGFVSYFSSSYNPKEGWKAFIIKGGPGTGKSTFMKKIASFANEKGYITELCPCSSDPDSLDAVIIPDLKITIMDGTAPHTVDPIYPAASDTILNFSEFWNGEEIQAKSKEIIELTDKNKQFHKSASRYLASAGQIFKDNLNLTERVTDTEKVRAYADKLCLRYIKHKGNGAGESVRFLSGISPKGIVNYPETLLSFSSQPFIIRDEHGNVSNEIMSILRDFALNKDYKIITCRNAYLPNLIDHLVIPELNAVFIRESRNFTVASDVRRVHAIRFLNNNLLKVKRLKYNTKIAELILDSAIVSLKEAKSIHDDLEGYYINSMNFNALEEFTDKFINEIF